MKRVTTLIAFAALASIVSADITSVMLAGTEATSVNLTAEGTTDWVMLGGLSGGAVSNRFEKAGADFIGVVDVSGTRDSWGGSAHRFDWSDGTAPDAAATGAYGNWEAKPMGGIDQFLSYSVDGLAVGEYAMMVYADKAGTGSEAILTAMMGVDSLSATATDADGDYAVFSVGFSIVNPGDSLDISYDLDVVGSEEWSNLNISAITVAAVPEPATFSLFAVMGGALYMIRRKSRR